MTDTLAAQAGVTDGPDWDLMLAAACAGDGLAAAYQPIVDVARGVIVGYEALARFEAWPERRPDRWFAAARERGCNAALESAALRTALRARRDLPANTFLTVNVSPDVVSSEPVRAVWRDEQELRGLVVELTEQAPVESYADLDGDLTALRAAGALIAVDDAGAGYAGLRHLLTLRPSIIKLDRDLIVDIDVDEAKRALVEMVGTFAGRVDAWLLAEGVERDGELDTLAALGVPLVQGYLLARPGPPWPELSVDVAARLVARGHAPAAEGTVRDVLEPTLVASSVEAAAQQCMDGAARPVVVVDEQTHPVAVFTPDLLHLGVAERGMRVNLNTPISEALLRAIAREPAERFQPLMCTDGAGRYLGVARIERLIHAGLLGPGGR